MDFTALARGRVFERVEDLRRQDVARGNREGARRVLGPGFLDEILDPEHTVGGGTRPRDAVVRHLRTRHLFERDDRTGTCPLEGRDHPLHDVARRMQPDDRVAESHHERVRSDERAGAEHGVSKAPQLPLARVEELGVRALVGELLEEVFLAGFAQRLRQLAVQVEVVFDRRLARPGDEEQALHPDARQFLDDVLHHGLAPDRQHLLRLGLGGRQQARAQAGDRNDGDVDGHDNRERTGRGDCTRQARAKG